MWGLIAIMQYNNWPSAPFPDKPTHASSPKQINTFENIAGRGSRVESTSAHCAGVSRSNPGNLPLLQMWHVGNVTGRHTIYTLIQCTPLLVEKAGVTPDVTFRITACKQERVQARYPLWIWNPWGRTHEVQNRSNQWLYKMDLGPDKKLKKKKTLLKTLPSCNVRMRAVEITSPNLLKPLFYIHQRPKTEKRQCKFCMRHTIFINAVLVENLHLLVIFDFQGQQFSLNILILIWLGVNELILQELLSEGTAMQKVDVMMRCYYTFRLSLCYVLWCPQHKT